MPTSPFDGLVELGFDVRSSFYADSLLLGAFKTQSDELADILRNYTIHVDELIRGGGGEATQTQRLGTELVAVGWKEEHEIHFSNRIEIQRNTNILLSTETKSETHKIDHLLIDDDQRILGLEVEWNNKDPFFDRDLETFSRLHMDALLSVGILITRGKSLQRDLEKIIARFGERWGLSEISELMEGLGMHPHLDQIGFKEPTSRQRTDIGRLEERGFSFPAAWAKVFTRDKYGSATTHWDKLTARLERGVGSPCPILSIGLPSGIVVE